MPLLAANNLHFSYGVRPVLQGVCVTLEAGEVVALLGPNGSGKSTLFRALLGQIRGEGQIEWEGRSLPSWGKRDLARRVAYLPQSPVYEAEQTVGDTLRLGRAPYWGAFGVESDRDLAAATEVAGLMSLSDLLDRRMDELSGGQRQRALVGRCLAQEPVALLLDEPTTFLDLRHQVELSRLLQKLAREKGMGVLMASHDLNLAAAYADRLVLLHEGAVVADGKAEKVMEPALLEKVYGVPMRRVEGNLVVPKI
jgi:iron complex transport system ATP-binding protein